MLETVYLKKSFDRASPHLACDCNTTASPRTSPNFAARWLTRAQSSLFGSHAEDGTLEAWLKGARGVMGRRKTKGENFPLSSFPSFLALPSPSHLSLIGSLSNNDRWRRLRKRHLKSEFAVLQTLSGLIPSSLIRQTADKFFWIWIAKKLYQRFSRRSRSVTDKKCIKNAQYACYFANLILLPLLSSLLKFHNINRRLWEDWGRVSRLGTFPVVRSVDIRLHSQASPPPPPHTTPTLPNPHPNLFTIDTTAFSGSLANRSCK